MLIILNPNIIFNNTMVRKGREIMPLKGESVGRNLMGPVRKNLDIPNELEHKLKRKEPIGRISLKVLNDVLETPALRPSTNFG